MPVRAHLGNHPRGSAKGYQAAEPLGWSFLRMLMNTPDHVAGRLSVVQTGREYSRDDRGSSDLRGAYRLYSRVFDLRRSPC